MHSESQTNNSYPRKVPAKRILFKICNNFLSHKAVDHGGKKPPNLSIIKTKMIDSNRQTTFCLFASIVVGAQETPTPG